MPIVGSATERIADRMCDLELAGGLLVTGDGLLARTVHVSDGRITAVSDRRCNDVSDTFDATGLYVLPGMIDQHVHFMETADPSREDWDHGSAAAAAGGVTTVIEHTHAAPVLDQAQLVEKIHFVTGRARVDFGLAAHVFPDTINEIAGLARAGASFLKAFTCTTHGVPGLDAARLLSVFRASAAARLRVLVHCEDETITAADEARVRATHRTDGSVVPEWRSTEAELSSVAVVALLARLTGATVTVAHASQPEVLDLVEAQQRRGAALTVETCPQYLLLSEDDVCRGGPMRKFTPPARAMPAGERMWEAVASGRIDVISADHAPSTRAQKLAGSIWDCPFGLPGIETVLPVLLGAVQDGRLQIGDVLTLYSETPARLLGLYPRKGIIAPGADADLVVVDPSGRQVLTDKTIVSKAGWTPFAGLEVSSPPVRVYLRGRLIAESGRPLDRQPLGRFARPGGLSVR